MKLSRGLVVLLGSLVIFALGATPALAQEQEPKQEPTEAANENSDKDPNENSDKQKKTTNGEDRKAGRESTYSESVTVTATRVESDLMKTPIAITVFDQETLDREGVHNVRDLAQMVPNMDIATKNGQSTPIISLRGIRSTNETELGDPAVGVHLDGIYSPRMQGILGLMFDNERVEVLRGPQGTLFGRNSTVGSINIITAKPKLDAFDAKMNLQYGNYNAPELQMMVNKPVTDTFAVRFAGRYYQRDSNIDGYWDPNQYDRRFISGIIGDPATISTGPECTGPKCFTRTQHSNWWIGDTDEVKELVPADDDDFYMNAKEWAYRASALWQPKYKDMSLNVGFQHFRTDGAGGVDLINCDKLRGRPHYDLVFDEDDNFIGLSENGTNDCSDMFPKDDTYQAVVNVPGRFFLDIMYLRSQFNWDIKDNLRLVHLTGVEDQDRESAQDMEQSLNAWDQAMFFLPGTGSKSWSQEIQLQSYGNQAFNWIIGANFFKETTSTIGYFDNAIDEKAFWDQPDRSTTAGALFAQGTYSYSDKWHLTIGTRFSDETREDKGGRSYICNVTNGCASSVIDGGPVSPGTNGFNRDDLGILPTDYFSDPSVYVDDNGTPNDPSDDFQVFTSNDNKGSWSHSDWRVGLDWQKDDDTLWYSYLATGFKAGGIGDVFEGTIHIGARDEDGQPILNDFGIPQEETPEEVNLRTVYEPEEVTTLELGFKKRLMDGNLQLRGAYFYSDYENMQYASVGSLAYTERWQLVQDINGDYVDLNNDGANDFGWVGSPLFVAYFTQNVPGAQIQGFELEYDWRPWTGGRIHGYGSWLDTEITEDWITKWDYDPRSYFGGLSFNEAGDASNPRLQVNLKGNNLAVSPPIKIHMTLDHAFLFEKKKMTIVPWVTAHWEDDSYLTIWNVDKHTDDMDFDILDEDIRYTDDRREAWSMLHAGVRLYSGNLMAEMYAYNITNEVVQWWGGAAEQVPKGSFSSPVSYGFRVEYKF